MRKFRTAGIRVTHTTQKLPKPKRGTLTRFVFDTPNIEVAREYFDSLADVMTYRMEDGKIVAESTF